MSSILEPALRRLGRARLRAGFAERLGPGLLAALLGVGCAALLARLLLGWSSPQAAWCLAGALLAPLGAAWLAHRDRWSEHEGATWLDVSAGGDGSLVTEAQTGDERWRERAAAALARSGEPEGGSWTGALSRGGLGLAFALAAVFVPMPEASAKPSGMFRGTLADLEETLETLEEEAGLDEERAESLEERLDQLREEAEAGNDPEATFEALDALAEDMERESDQLAEAMEDAAEELAASLGGQGEDSGEVAEGLQNALEQLAAGGVQPPAPTPEGLDLPEGLELPAGFEWPEGTELGELAALDPELAEALSEAMREELLERLAALAEAGLLEGGEFRLGELREGLGELMLGEAGELCESCKEGKPCEEPEGEP